MSETRAHQHWQETFGLTEQQYNQPGFVVCPLSGGFAGRNAAMIFLHGETCIISCPPDLVDKIREKTQALKVSDVMMPDSLAALFGERINRTTGPAYQGCVEKEGLLPVSLDHVRRLVPANKDIIDAFAQACSREDLDNSGVHLDSDCLLGCFEDNKLLAIAGIIQWSSQAANPAILVHPAYRGQGYGKAVASAAMKHILDQGSVVLYQTLMDNKPAVAIAESLGCRLYARTMYVAFREAAG